MHAASFIEHKREGHEHPSHDIAEWVRDFTGGTIPDYQITAWAMAVYFQGMTDTETAALTQAMLASGRSLHHPRDSPPKVDKHSTGGVGDKVSLVLAPLLACDDLWVPMISGRGLGITGGTLDKLGSIPGFRTSLDAAETEAQLARLGVCMIGQTADLCPADRKLYALRDVTGTVPSQPLIVASIMSKKLAETLDRLVLDVKWGLGAFMKTRVEAEQLAAAMSRVGSKMGVQVVTRLTPMDEPLGCTAGNALEVAEAVAALQGGGPPDLVELTLDLAATLSTKGREPLARWLQDGTAWRKFVALVEAQGGDSTALERMAAVHPAPVILNFPSPVSGLVQRVDAGAIGRLCVFLGAGRSCASDFIDPAVGCDRIVKTGTQVAAGESLLRIHARNTATAERAFAALPAAFDICQQ